MQFKSNVQYKENCLKHVEISKSMQDTINYDMYIKIQVN